MKQVFDESRARGAPAGVEVGAGLVPLLDLDRALQVPVRRLVVIVVTAGPRDVEDLALAALRGPDEADVQVRTTRVLRVRVRVHVVADPVVVDEGDARAARHHDVLRRHAGGGDGDRGGGGRPGRRCRCRGRGGRRRGRRGVGAAAAARDDGEGERGGEGQGGQAGGPDGARDGGEPPEKRRGEAPPGPGG